MSERADALRMNGGLKWSFHDEDVLAGWVAEMDFGLAPVIAEALHDAIDRGLTGYAYPDAEQDTAVAASRFWRDRFGWETDPTWVAPAPDVIEGIRRAIVHLTRPRSPVVVHSPVYYPFYGMVERAGRDLIEVRCERDTDDRYRLNLAGIDRALDEGAGSIVVCNPWNPTGRVLSTDELAELVDLVARHRARIIVDEVHAAITYDGARHVPLAGLDPEMVVTVTSASKAWNLPGLKCAQVVLTNEADRETWLTYFTPEKVGVGTFGLFANAAAYSGGAAWLDGVMETLASNRGLLVGLVSEQLPLARLDPPQGTYLAWLDLGAYGLEHPAEFLLADAKVALTDGAPFGSGASRFVRLNFATDPAILTEIVERTARSLHRHPPAVAAASEDLA